jgi:hydroxypyruvate reductase
MWADPRDLLLRWFTVALDAVDGHKCVRSAIARRSLQTPVSLIAIGKAAVAMARGACDELGDQIDAGFVVTKYGHEGSLPWPVLTAGHPMPDQASLDAGETLLVFTERVPKENSVLFLLSGGASSLVEVLVPGVGLAQLQQLNQWILGSGIDIVAANELRKSISMLKAGRLAQHLAPHTVICLTISDVPGNDPHSIGSGPLVRPGDFILPENLPAWIPELIERTPVVATSSGFDHVQTEIIATIENACLAATKIARSEGHEVRLHETLLRGDALLVGQQLANVMKTSRPGQVHIWGGETTVLLPPKPGRGGRSQSLALAAAIALEGTAGQYLLAVGTDGSDGPGSDAGALVDSHTVQRGRAAGIDAAQALESADAGSFLEASGDLIATGPTGTNVMDLVIGITT